MLNKEIEPEVLRGLFETAVDAANKEEINEPPLQLPEGWFEPKESEE